MQNRHPCKSSVKKKARECWSRSGERAFILIRPSACACASRLVVPAPAGPDIHLLPRAPKSRRRRLSLCSLPVPKQCEGSLGSFLRRPGDLLQDLAACASNDLVFVLPYQEGFLSHCFGHQLFGRYEVLLPAVHREHVCHQLSGYRHSGPILVPSLDFLLPEQGQLVGVPGRQLGGFH